MKDKLLAILAILRAKEFAVFTCKSLRKAKGAECIYSQGLEDKENSKIFRESVSKFIKL
jgi:hypothetical protein